MMVSRRFGLIGESFGFLLLAIVGVLLLALTSVAAALSLLWIGIPLTLGALVLLRSFADLHRSWAARIGIEIPRPYRPAVEGGPIRRLVARTSDPATWRAELRRIERDLHDGAQARLAGVGLRIGMAEEMLTRDPEKVPQLLADARESAGVAMAELRDLVRGIHPPALADRGLAGGLKALALASSRAVGAVLELPGRPPAAVESAAYFAVAELLANATKHSDADQIRVTVQHAGCRLVATVTDNGLGEAVARPGSGLDGIARRLAAFDGSLDIDNPAGGPTTITIAVPCVLS